MLSMVLGMALALGGLLPTPAFAAQGDVTLYTPYTDISVMPGETINYSIDVLNQTGSVQEARFTISGPEGWEHTLTAGGWSVSELSVKPNSTQSLNLEVEVPLKVEKGEYRVTLEAEGKSVLPLTIRVAEQGSFRTELTSEQPNRQGSASSSFSFSANLRNRTADKQVYALTAEAPRGWAVTFAEGGQKVTSVSVDASGSKTVSIDAKPPENVTAGSYKIPVAATSGGTSAKLELEVVITGTYEVALSTPQGVLSTDVTAGGERKLELVVANKGSSDLTDLELSSTLPSDWEATFEPRRIAKLEPGKSASVQVSLKSSDKAIAGDYASVFSVRSPEASDDAEFRVTVKTSVLWGFTGILVIAAVVGGIYYLFRKYGRR
nr:NEW3 domain-containing protein [Paenibacillus turpanensis]